MKYGVVFPQNEIGNDVVQIRDFVQTVEGLGFDFLLAYDHVLGANPEKPEEWRGPYTHEDPFHEVFVLFSYLAGITTTLEFATGILISPQRQTALVAKQAASLALLSGGRFRMGVGVGWNHVEYDSLGMPFNKRGRIMDEQVRLLRELWRDDTVTFKGDFHDIERAGINPLPPNGHIPIWFGGAADVVLKRMARLGDGWMPPSYPIERAQELTATLRQYLAEAGRSDDNFGIDARVSVGKMSMQEQADYIRGWTDLGATHIGAVTLNAGYTTLDQHLNAIRDFHREFVG